MAENKKGQNEQLRVLVEGIDKLAPSLQNYQVGVIDSFLRHQISGISDLGVITNANGFSIQTLQTLYMLKSVAREFDKEFGIEIDFGSEITLEAHNAREARNARRLEQEFLELQTSPAKAAEAVFGFGDGRNVVYGLAHVVSNVVDETFKETVATPTQDALSYLVKVLLYREAAQRISTVMEKRSDVNLSASDIFFPSPDDIREKLMVLLDGNTDYIPSDLYKKVLRSALSIFTQNSPVETL